MIGGRFVTAERPEAGHSATPRAEAGTPVHFGAVLRMVAVLTDPPTVRMVIDTGQSGHPRHRHWDDMWQRWSAGEPFHVPVTREEVEAAAEGRLRLQRAQ